MCVVYETEEEEEGLKISNIMINKKEKKTLKKNGRFFFVFIIFPNSFHSHLMGDCDCLSARETE